MQRFETWDYSARNCEFLTSSAGRQPKLLRLGYHPKLARIPRPDEQPIDVLFYGSVNDRRRALFDEVKARGLAFHEAFGLYGAERDALIGRSKLVLNAHMYDAKIFEIVRIFYLMTNAKAVVAEVGDGTDVSPAYVGGFAAAPYKELAERCAELIANEAARRTLEDTALDTIRAHPQKDYMAALLDG